MISVTIVEEQQAQARSIIGNTADGYEEGKEQSAHDKGNGNGYDSGCHNGGGGSLAWCTGFKAGYVVGYAAAGALED
jgi:hypothetical protein